MKLTYLPDDKVIVADDPDRAIVASLSMAALSWESDVDTLGQAFAAAPDLLRILDDVTNCAPDDSGNRILTPNDMMPIWAALTAFAPLLRP